MRLWTLLFTGSCAGAFALLLASCQSPKGTVSTLSGGPVGGPGKEDVFRTEQNIYQGVLSETDNKMYFLMESPTYRSSSQVYEISIAPEALENVQRKPRPLTWQGGQVQSFDVSEGALYYASTTDEIKERVHTNQYEDTMGLPTEIYARPLHTDAIERLTERPGFDGDVNLGLDGKYWVYSLKEWDQWKILEFNRLKKKNKPNVVAQGKDPLRFPTYDVTQELAWIQSDDITSVNCRGGAKVTPTLGEKFMSLKRAPVAGWLALGQNPLNSRKSTVYYIGPKCACAVQIYTVDVPLSWVEASNTPPRIFYSERKGDQTRVLAKPLPLTAFACPIVAEPATVKE